MQAITTVKAKKKILLARAGKLSLPKITKMAFGDGGVSPDGNLTGIEETQEELNNEIYRKDIKCCEIVSDTKVKYVCELGENELANKKISEIGLVDEDGDILTIKHFAEKEKDGDFAFTFKVNDTM